MEEKPKTGKTDTITFYEFIDIMTKGKGESIKRDLEKLTQHKK